MEFQAEVLSNFMAITGSEHDVAVNMLTASDWALETAVGLYFATHDAGAPSMPSTSGSQVHKGDSFDDDVRAPIPAKTDTLYGNIHQAALPRPPVKKHEYVDVFRDFKAESDKKKPSASTSSGLSELFKPPSDLLFLGDFSMAKDKAQADGKWLLINVQSATEFASHRLNRDTWGHAAITDLLKNSFVFFQTYDTSDQGQKLAGFYRLESFPSTLIVDPMTGATLFQKYGFIDPEKLMEDLVPFLDHGPRDAGAVHLAQASYKRKKPSAAEPAQPSRSALTEDEELELALAMSMEEQAGDDEAMEEASSSGGEEEEDKDFGYTGGEVAGRTSVQQASAAAPQAAPAKPSPEQLRSEAEQRLPAEPADSDPAGCRIAIRLPDGSRLQRRFLKCSTLHSLVDFITTKLPDDVVGQTFSITPTFPGAAALQDLSLTLEEAGVANSMLAVKMQ